MQASSPIPKQSVGRTFFAAIILLGLVALVQLGAVGWVFITRLHTSQRNDAGVLVKSSHAPPEETLRLAESFAPPEDATAESLPKPTPITQISKGVKLSPAQGRLNELAEVAKALRDRGDMSTALTRLREAQALSPDNPFIISEMAITYEKMGMKDKALEQWRRIRDMGESAGIYYSAADAKLKNAQGLTQDGDSTKKDSEGFQPGSVLALVDINRVVPDDGADKKFTLRVPLKRRADTKIDVHDVVIQVFFYDLVDDQSIVQTNANMTYRWATVPVDWNESDIEILEVDYTANAASAKEKHPENRKYLGYIVRVYYKNELQDMRADPLKLLKQYPPPLSLQSEEMK